MDFLDVLATRFPVRLPDDAREAPSSCRGSLAKLKSMYQSNWTGLNSKLPIETQWQEQDQKQWTPFSGWGKDYWKSMKKSLKGFIIGKQQAYASRINITQVEKQWTMCGRDWSTFNEGWHQCKATWPGKRGITCGIWNLFHFVAAGSTDETAGGDLLKLYSAFDTLFGPDNDDFKHMVRLPVPDASNSWTRRDAQLYWWKAHNSINRAVAKQESGFGPGGDPAFPKSPWPTAAECPRCRLPSGSKASASTRPLVQSPTLLPVAVVKMVKEVGTLGASSSAEDSEPVQPVVTEVVDTENWDLDAVVQFLDQRYGGGNSVQINDGSFKVADPALKGSTISRA